MKFLILAGGSGTRLWPLSNDKQPKQFHKFVSERTLLQMAYDRLIYLNAKPEDIYISSNQNYKQIIQEQLPDLSEKNLILEPARRDTAPCISFAMKYIANDTSQKEVVTIINADQLITDEEEFKHVVLTAQKTAKEEEKLILVSVKTKSPNPNLGYIKIDQLHSRDENVEVYTLDQFVEKPDPERAKQFHQSFKYLWNTAIFTWKIETFLEHLQNQAPEVSKILNSIQDFNNCAKQYESFPKISIDFALMEKVPNTEVLVIPADLGWSDIGTWETLYDELGSDNNEQVIKQGNITYDDSNKSLFINRQKDKEVILIGLDNFVVVNTEDKLLVAPIDQSKKLKEVLSKHIQNGNQNS